MSKILQREKFRGMHTKHPVTKNHPDTAFLAWNAKVTGEGIEPVKGFSEYGGSAPAQGQSIEDAFTFTLQTGVEIPIRVRKAAAESVVEWYDATNKLWYILLPGLTRTNHFSFFDYNTSTNNQMFFGNGVENYSVWTGQTTRLIQAVTATDTEVYVDSTSGFAASGTIIYNGTEIAYSALGSDATGAYFTVASAHASDGAADGVAVAVDDATHSGVALSKMMISAQNRVYLIDEDDPNAMEYSVEGDATDWTAGDTRADAGIEDFPVVGGRLTGLAAKNSYIFLFKEKTIILFKWNYPSRTTKTPDYKHIVTGADVGAISHRAIGNVYNDILYTTRNGIRSLNQDISTDDWNAEPISDVIAPTIKDYLFDEDTVSIYYEKEDVYLTACKSDSNQSKNNRVIAIWYYNETDAAGNEVRRKGFSILDWTVASWFIYGGNLFFGSSMAGVTYKAFSGYTKDGTTLKSILVDNRNDFGSKVIKGAESYQFFGLIKAGTEIDVEIIYDGGKQASQLFTIKASGDYVTKNTLKTLGAFKIGEEILGGTLDEASDLMLFDFTIPLQVKQFYDIQLSRTQEKKGGYYKIFSEGLVNPNEEFDIPLDTFY